MDDDARSVAEQEIYDQMADLVGLMENLGWHHLGVEADRNILYSQVNYVTKFAQIFLQIQHSDETG